MNTPPDNPQVYVEHWSAQFGSPIGALADQQDVEAVLLEDADDPARNAVTPRPPRTDEPLAFVDGVRRIDAHLYSHRPGGRVFRGVAGSHAQGAVVCATGEPARVVAAQVTRQLVWGGGEAVPLPAAGGLAYESVAVQDEDPEALVLELQNRMRIAESELAEGLAAQGTLVLLDGPLNITRSRDLPLAGYIKTHHRQLLAPAEQQKIPLLEGGERTPLFQVRRVFYTCYLRLVPRRPQDGPWHGVVRLEVPQSAGLDRARMLVDELAHRLPHFVPRAHKDPRAPVNLQPIGALERELKHRLGHPRLAEQAVRAAAARTLAAPALSTLQPPTPRPRPQRLAS